MPRGQRETTKQAPNEADGWFTPGRFMLVLGALLIACFPQVVFGFETFFVRDYSGFTYSLAFYQRECFWRGELPLWNPANFCGEPFLAQWNTSALYPPTLIYLLLPLTWSLGMLGLAHIWLAGVGMYFLAYRWTGNRFAASVAGVAFAFNGMTWNALIWTSNLAAIAWMPWVKLLTERAWREGGRYIALAALAGAVQMLAGSPEAVLLTWFIAGVLWIAELVREESKLRLTWRFWMVPLLVAGLSAVQLLPFLDLLAHSERSTGMVDPMQDAKWAMPLSGWANYLVPLFHCFKGSFGTYSQAGQYWTASYYMGVATIMLAVLAVWQTGKNRRVWILAALGIAGVLLAMGDNGLIYGLLRRLPGVGLMRYAIKFAMLTSFVLPLLAAHGVAWLQASTQRTAARNRLWTFSGIVTAVIVLIVAWASQSPATGENPHTTLLNAIVRLVFLALIVGALVAMQDVPTRKLQLSLRAGVLLFLWLDVFTHAPTLSPTVETSVYAPDTMRQFFNWGPDFRPGESRAMQSSASITRMMYQSAGTATDDLNGRRLSLFANLNLLDHVSKFDGFASLLPQEIRTLATRAYAATNAMNGLKDFVGISKESNPTNAVDWISRKSFLPMITIGQEPVFAEDATALQQVLSDEFDPAHRVYLQPDARKDVTATNRTDAKVLSRTFSAEHIGAEVESAAPAMVVVAQTYYHCWRAKVDGKPADLFRANYAFQALEVPAGKHRVELDYVDAMFRTGAVISFASLCVCTGIWWLGRKRTKQA